MKDVIINDNDIEELDDFDDDIVNELSNCIRLVSGEELYEITGDSLILKSTIRLHMKNMRN